MIIEVYCKNELLKEDGKHPIWTGTEDHIQNIPFEVPKMIAVSMKLKNKIECTYGMWTVKIKQNQEVRG